MHLHQVHLHVVGRSPVAGGPVEDAPEQLARGPDRTLGDRRLAGLLLHPVEQDVAVLVVLEALIEVEGPVDVGIGRGPDGGVSGLLQQLGERLKAIVQDVSLLLVDPGSRGYREVSSEATEGRVQLDCATTRAKRTPRRL